MSNSLDGVTGSGGAGSVADQEYTRTVNGRPKKAQRRRSTNPDVPVVGAGDLKEITPPEGPVLAPPYGYVLRLLRGREREMGASASGSRSVRDAGTRLANSGTRSFTDIVREIRKRRKLQVTPPIPPGYRKTTQVVRAGQALFADLCHRLPAVLAAKPMVVSADPVDDDDDAQETATLKEEWTTAVLLGSEGRRATLDNGKTAVWRDAIDNLVNTGRACWSLVERLDRWSEWSPSYPKADDFEDDDGYDREAETTVAGAVEGYLREQRTPARLQPGEKKPRSREQKYLKAVEAFKRATPPFVLEHIDPLSLHLVEDGDGVEDEAVVVVNRPYRETLAEYGLNPTEREGPGTVKGARVGARYEAGPLGFGKPYPLDDAEPDRPYEPEHCETVTYYCSAKRAWFLGLSDPKDPDWDPDCGVWAHYVDGVLVASGPLWGPSWHPLPVFRAFGLTTSMADPTYTGVAAPMHLVELIDLLDQIITMELHVSFWSSWPPLIEEDKTGGAPGAAGLSGDVVLDPERPQRPDGNRTTDGKIVEPGRFYSVPPGRTWRYLTLPAESTAHLERLYAKASALVDLIGIPSVMRGQGGSGQAGYAVAQLMIAARSLYDPIVENLTAQVANQVQYLWWQVWKRFPEGVPVYYPGSQGLGRKKGWKTLTPKDIAPDSKDAGQGTPFLACSIEADPLLPVDEAQLEMRGIQAQQAGAVDMLTMRERYFHDPAPERTEARVLADKINTHPLVQESMSLRGAVREGVLTPEMALSWLQAKFGVDPQMAFDQLLQIGAFTQEEAARLLLQLQLAAAAGQAQPAVPGMPPGAPGAPAMPGAPGAPPMAPGVPPMAPPGGMPPAMPPPPGGPMAGGMPGPGLQPAPGMGMPGQPQPAPAAGMPMQPQPAMAGGGGGSPYASGGGAPMGGVQPPMQSGGPIQGTPAPVPGVPMPAGLPAVTPQQPFAPQMGVAPTGGGTPAPGQAWGVAGTGEPIQSPWQSTQYGATGGGAAIPAAPGVIPSRAGLPQHQTYPWQKAARELTR